MNHRFRSICPNAKPLLKDVDNLNTFMRRIEKLSNDPAWTSRGWNSDEYKGDALEAMVEVLIKCSPIDKRINIVDYRPHDKKIDGKDMGIDGYGISHNGNLHTVQIKYRSNVQKTLTANEDHISNFVATTTASPKYHDADMTIFTTAKDLNTQVKENMYHNRVHVIGYKDLSALTKQNIPFWNTFRSEMGV
jgi:hypothetical protein